MKLYIEHIKILHQRNIFNQPISYHEYWVVYRKMCFGLFRKYLCVNGFDGNGELDTVKQGGKMPWFYDTDASVKFTTRRHATWYGQIELAKQLIESIYKEPNKYILT